MTADTRNSASSGDISPTLGHHGVLFLDELTEFRAKIDLPKETPNRGVWPRC
jgi:predicted ATPase with chaperone activity